MGAALVAGTPIWLAGLMGAGKSTVGTALAAALDCPFLDNDDQLAARTGRPLAAWSDLAALHAAERDLVDDLLARPGRFVAALPASSADPPDRLDDLGRAGLLVYLRAPRRVRAARIRDTGRPPEPPRVAGRDARYAEAAGIVLDATCPPARLVELIRAAAADRDPDPGPGPSR